MAEEKRLSKVARELNVGMPTIVDFLSKKGFVVENNPNSKISVDQFNILRKEFESSALDKQEASSLNIGKKEYVNEPHHRPAYRDEDDDFVPKQTPKEPVVEKPKVEAAKPQQ